MASLNPTPSADLLALIEQSGGNPIAIDQAGQGTDGQNYSSILGGRPIIYGDRPSGRSGEEIADQLGQDSGLGSGSSYGSGSRPFNLLGSGSSNSILAFLQQLVSGSVSMDKLTDQQYTQLQNLIDYYKYLEERGYNRDMQLEQRGYDYSMLLDERNYNSPEQMLSRLMATGLSRQAALSLIQSAGSSGSGSGSGSVPYASGVPQNQLGLSPSESSLNNTNRDLSVLGAVMSTLSGVAGLVTAGFSIKNMVVQNALSKNALIAGSLQNQATHDVGQFVKALYAVNPETGKRYTELPETALMSAESVLRYAQNVKQDENPFLYDYMRSSSAQSFAQNPYAWQLFDSSFLQHTDARRRALEDDAILQSELLQTQSRLASVNLQQSYESLQKFMEEHEDYQYLRPYLTEKNLLQVNDDIQMLAASQTPEQLAYRLNTLKNHNATLAFISLVDKMQAQNYLELYRNEPIVRNCITLASVFDKLGLSGIVGEVVRTSGYLGVGFSEVLDSLGNPNSQDESSMPLEVLPADYVQNSHLSNYLKEYIKDLRKLIFDRFGNSSVQTTSSYNPKDPLTWH